MKVLVTGATGLVGNSVYEYLCKSTQLEVVASGRKKLCKTKSFIAADLFNDDLDTVFSDYEFDCIIHCAALIPNKNISDIDCYNNNTVMDRKVFDYAKRKKSKIIYISSAVLYGISDNTIKTEKSDVNIISEYHRGKYESEKYLEKNEMNYICMRIPSPYGEKQSLNTVMKIFVDNIVNKRDLFYYGTGNKTQNFIHVLDIARAVERAIYSEKKGVYNIAAQESVSMLELANIVQDACYEINGYKTNVLPAGKPDAQDDVRINISIEKAKKELNWYPQITLSEGIKKWVKEKS